MSYMAWVILGPGPGERANVGNTLLKPVYSIKKWETDSAKAMFWLCLGFWRCRRKITAKLADIMRKPDKSMKRSGPVLAEPTSIILRANF